MIAESLFMLLVIFGSGALLQQAINRQFKKEYQLLLGVLVYIGSVSYLVSFIAMIHDARPLISVIYWASVLSSAYFYLKNFRRLRGLFTPIRIQMRDKYLLAIAFIVIVSLIHNILFAYEGFDGIGYHLPFAVEAFKTGHFDLQFNDANREDFLYLHKITLPFFYEGFIGYSLAFHPEAYKLLPTLAFILFLGFSYYFARLFFDRKKAIFGTALLSATPLLAYHSIMLYTDLMHASFIVASLYCILRWKREKESAYLFYSAAFISVAALIKLPILALAFSIPLILVKDRKSVLLYFAVLSLIFIPHYAIRIASMTYEGFVFSHGVGIVYESQIDFGKTLSAVLDSIIIISRSADFTPYFYLGIIAMLLAKDDIAEMRKFSIVSVVFLIIGYALSMANYQSVSLGFRRHFLMALGAVSVPFLLSVYDRNKKILKGLVFLAFVLSLSYSLLIFYARSDFNGNLNTVTAEIRQHVVPEDNLTVILTNAHTIPKGSFYLNYPGRRFKVMETDNMDAYASSGADYILVENTGTNFLSYTPVYTKNITIYFPKEERSIRLYKKEMNIIS